MAHALLERILRESGAPELLDILAERLSPTDLQSLLLEVYRQRASQRTPAQLLAEYEQNRFVQPGTRHPQALIAFEHLAFRLAQPLFEPLELSPVCPLGTNAVVATVDQNNAVATVRNTEVISDSTNVLALECAVRRRVCLRSPEQRHMAVRVCASHRLLRAQHFNRPGAVPHFRLFGMCTAGRDTGSYQFELQALREQLGLYIRLLQAVQQRATGLQGIRIALTDFGQTRQELVQQHVFGPLAQEFPAVAHGFDPARTSGQHYYDQICFHIYASDDTGQEIELADGGFTTWTQQLLSNKKERLLISGIGFERIPGLGGLALA